MSVLSQRNYLATVILDTRGYEEPVEKLIDHLRNVFTHAGAEISSVENLGRRDFVRVTDKKHPGDTYIRIAFAGAATVPDAIRERTRLDRHVERLMIESAS